MVLQLLRTCRWLRRVVNPSATSVPVAADQRGTSIGRELSTAIW